jgi:23S rRNA pseudouridine1911/1915/1917 synthase
MRLDLYLAKQHPERSRSVWQKLIRDGRVRVNRIIVTQPRTEVDEGADVEISEKSYQVEALDLPVIFEDENVVVIDKPVGVLSHSKGALNEEFTVADFIGGRDGIVHRLDRATSGLMIGAKNAAAKAMLQRQFQDRRAKKTYLAVVDVTPKGRNTIDENGREFTIDLPIARNPKIPSQFKVDAKGKSAVTEVKIVEITSTKALLELKPKTGRTHQLRVHLAYVGLPIVDDPIYGKNILEHKTPLFKVGPRKTWNGEKSRMMLHAKELEITIPGGVRRVFMAEVPDGFKRIG